MRSKDYHSISWGEDKNQNTFVVRNLLSLAANVQWGTVSICLNVKVFPNLLFFPFLAAPTMGPKDDPSLQIASEESSVNFASLIGSQACMARRLDLRWRWELQLQPESNDGNEDDTSSMPSTPEEMLTRKQYHTMPFLMRNLSNYPFQFGRRNRSCRRRRKIRTVQHVPTKTADVISQCFGIGSPNRFKRKRAEEESTGIMGNIKQRITGWFSPQDMTKESSVKAKGGQGQPSISSQEVSRSRPLSAYELYIQSPQVRRMILSEIDSSLHHDEEFIMNRIEATWQEMTSDESKTSNVDTGINAGEALSSDITKRSYWLEMEKRDKSKFDDDSTTSKKRKLSHSTYSPTVHSTLSNWNTRSNHPVYFHYMYINENNHPCTIVEKRLDRKCPFCTYNGKSDEDLMGHFGIYHGVLAGYYPWKNLAHGFSFEAVMDEEKDLHIVVKSLWCSSEAQTALPVNFTFVRCKHETVDYSISFLKRLHKNVAAMEPAIRRKRLVALETNDAPASVISSYLPTDEVPVRQYYHSRTNLPLEDWNHVDSDDEPDEEWLHKMSADLIGEFEDISDREKKFMQLWNRFIKSHIVIADRDMPGKCQEFIRTHINELRSGEMRSNLLLHLMNLWDAGVVSSNRILACMNQFDEGMLKND
jgi:hypothetical protein